MPCAPAGESASVRPSSNPKPACVSYRLCQSQPKILRQRICPHLFERSVLPVTVGGLPAPCGQTQRHPIRCTIAGPAPACLVGERFQVVDRMVVDAFPSLVGASAPPVPKCATLNEGRGPKEELNNDSGRQ